MVFHLEFSERARRNLRQIFQTIHAEFSPPAARWYERLEDAILSIERTPYANPVTPEDPTARQLIFGNKPHLYRVIYDVVEATGVITIQHIRHGRRDRRPPTKTPPGKA